MAILSFQGYYGGDHVPVPGPVRLQLVALAALLDRRRHRRPTPIDIHTAAENSLFLSTRRRRDRRRARVHALDGVPPSLALRLDAVGVLRDHARADDAGLPARRRHAALLELPRARTPSIWKTALGANVVWGIPFGFLVMLAVWNRYDPRVEEAARDLGADQRRTFREVTLPLVWTGLFGCFLFGFTLTWNDYDRSVLFQTRATDSLPLEIGGHHLHQRRQARPLRARHGDDALLAARDRVLLVVASVRLPLPRRRRSSGRGGARRHRGDRRRGNRNRRCGDPLPRRVSAPARFGYDAERVDSASA